jgi:hypothetical protein
VLDSDKEINKLNGDVMLIQVELAEIRSQIDSKKLELKDLERIKSDMEKEIEEKEGEIIGIMSADGVVKQVVGAFEYTILFGKESVVINNENLPKEFINTKVTETPDKKKIKEALKDSDNYRDISKFASLKTGKCKLKVVRKV